MPKAGTSRYGMGVAAADMDNDGWTDVVLTSVGGITLLRNERGARFVDVTARAGLADRRGFSTCAVWVDVDRDGLVDLLVCNYVQWSPQTDLYCSAGGTQKTYCTPQAYRGSTSWLFRNLGGGRFEDVTAKAGLFDVTGKALGATVLDHDGDGWPDLFVANDTVPNRLYRNNHDGTFTELGLQSGVAFSTDGRARAGMGVDAADVDNSGRASVAVTNFSGEMLGLFVPQEAGVYVDAAPQSAVGRATRQTLGWGCFFFDVDLDGWQDLLVVNGQLDPSLARSPGDASPPHLFLNRQGRFEDVARSAGGAFAAARIGRGAAFADIDRDGDPDVVLTANGGPAQLFRNDSTPRGGVVGLRLHGTASQPRRDRHPGDGRRQRRQGQPDGADGLQLSLPVRTRADVRPRIGGRARGRRRRMAGTARREARASAGGGTLRGHRRAWRGRQDPLPAVIPWGFGSPWLGARPSAP